MNMKERILVLLEKYNDQGLTHTSVQKQTFLDDY